MKTPSPAPSASPSSPIPAKPAAGLRRRSRWWPWLGGGLLVAAIIAGLWPKALPVEMAAVTRGDLVVTVDEEGMTRVKNRYVISSPVAGQLQRIDWKAGAVVEASRTPLAVIGTSGAAFLDARGQAEAEARIRATAANQQLASAQRERARAAATLAKRDLERFRTLNATGAISQQDFDAAMMRAATTAQEERAGDFALQVAQFEAQQARATLLRGLPGTQAEETPLTVRSPVSGRVLRVLQESARVVPAGLPLIEVGDPTDLEARIEVLSRDGVAIRPGARVMIEQWGGDQPLEARVRLVEPSAFTKISALGVEEQRVYVVVDFIDPVESRPTLGDNYRVEARIVIWEGKHVLRVPAGALFQRGTAWQTFVVDGRHAQLRSVEIGRTNGLETEIRGGLKEGERVVVYPGDKIDDGTRIAPLAASARPAPRD